MAERGKPKLEKATPRRMTKEELLAANARGERSDQFGPVIIVEKPKRQRKAQVRD